MRFSIISEIPGRTRLQLAGPVPESDLDALLKLSGDIDGVHKVRVYGRIGQMALEFDEQCRAGAHCKLAVPSGNKPWLGWTPKTHANADATQQRNSNKAAIKRRGARKRGSHEFDRSGSR